MVNKGDRIGEKNIFFLLIRMFTSCYPLLFFKTQRLLKAPLTFYICQDMTPPPVKILVPKPSSPGTPEEGEVTDDDDDAQYVVVRHADGRTEVVTKEEEESKESGTKSEKVKEYEMVDENKVAQEDSEEDKGVKFQYIIATKMKPKTKGSKIVKRDEEGNVIDTGDSDNRPGDETEDAQHARNVQNVTEEKKDQTGIEKDASGSNEIHKGLKEKITGDNSKSEGEKGDDEPSGSEIQKGNETGDTCETNLVSGGSHSQETESEEKVEQTEDPVEDDETCINEEPETVIHVDDKRPLKAEELNVTDSEVNENEDKSSVQQTTLETGDNEESSAPIDATEQNANTVVRNTSSILFTKMDDREISTEDQEVNQDDNKEESTVEKKTSGIIFGKVYTDSDILFEDEKEPTLLVVPAEGSMTSPQSENEDKEKLGYKTKNSGVGFYVQSSEEETEVDVIVKDEPHSSGEYEEHCEGDKVSKVSVGEEGKIKRSKIKDSDIAKKHVSKQVTDAYDNEEEHEETECDRSKLDETKKEQQDREDGNKSQNKVPETKKKIDVSETMGQDGTKASKKTIKKRKSEDKVSEVPVKESKAELSKAKHKKLSSQKRTDENKKEEGKEQHAPSVRRIKVQGALLKPSTKDSAKIVESSDTLTTDRRLVQKKESSENGSSLRNKMNERNDSSGTQPMPVARKVVVDGTTGQRRLKASIPEDEQMEEELDYDDEEVGQEGCDDTDTKEVQSKDGDKYKDESKPEFDRQTTKTKRKIMVLQTGGLIVRSKTESEEMPRKELNKEKVQPVTSKASAPKTGELNKKTAQPKETSVTESKQKSKTLETKGSKGSIADTSITKHTSQSFRLGTSSVRDNIKAEELRIQKLKEELRKREDELRKTAAAARLKAAGLLKEDLAVALIGKQPSKPDEEVPSTSKAATKGKQNDSDDDDVKLETSEDSDDEDVSETEKRSEGRSSSPQRSYSESESDRSDSEYVSEDDRRKRSKRTSHRKSNSYSRSRSRSREKSRRSKKSRSRSRHSTERNRSRHSTERSRSRHSRDKRPKERSYSGRMRSDEMGEDYDRHKIKPKIESSVSRVSSSDRSRRKNWPPPEFPDPRDFPPHFFDYPPPPEFFEQFGPMPYFFFPRGRGRGRVRGRGRGAFMYPTSPRGRDYEKYGGSRSKYHGRSRSYERSRSRSASRSRSRSYEKEKSLRKHHRSPHYDRDRSYERDYDDTSRSREKGTKYNRKSGEQSPMRKKTVIKTGRKGNEPVIERRFVKVEPLEKRIKAPGKEKQVRPKSSTATRSESKSSRSKASTSKETKSSAKLSPKYKPGAKYPVKVTPVKKPTKKAASSGESSGKHNQEGKRKKSEGVAILTESQMEILELEMRARAIKAMLQEAKSKEAKKVKNK